MLSTIVCFQLINYHRRKVLTWISIYRLKGCIEPFVYSAGARFKSHLNEISLGVHRMGKLLTTDLKVVRFSSMRGNVCDKDPGTIIWRSSTVIIFTCYQGKVQEGQFDDFPNGYSDIPGTNPAWVIAVGKIGAGNVTTWSIDGFSRRNAGWKNNYLSVTLLVSYCRQKNSSKIEIENVLQTSTFVTISLLRMRILVDLNKDENCWLKCRHVRRTFILTITCHQSQGGNCNKYKERTCEHVSQRK